VNDAFTFAVIALSLTVAPTLSLCGVGSPAVAAAAMQTLNAAAIPSDTSERRTT
jgi:hypothetical protein